MNLSAERNAFYAFGGYEESGNKLFVLNNISGIEAENWVEEWDTNTIPTVGRAAHASVVIGDRIYIHGGYGAQDSNSEFHVFSSMEAINLQDFTCEKVLYRSVVANVERRWHQSFAIDRKIFVHGGWNDGGPLDDLIYFDVDSLDWKTMNFTSSIPKGRRWHTLTRISETNSFFMFGGFDGDKKKKLGDLHFLNVETEEWSEVKFKGDAPTPRCKHCFCQIREKEFLLIGGEDNKELTNSDILVFHSDDCSFKKISNAKELYESNRAHAKCFKISEHGLLIGGGWVSKYLTPFMFLDIRMLKL